jgi:hypothetical protein
MERALRSDEQIFPRLHEVRSIVMYLASMAYRSLLDRLGLTNVEASKIPRYSFSISQFDQDDMVSLTVIITHKVFAFVPIPHSLRISLTCAQPCV